MTTEQTLAALMAELASLKAMMGMARETPGAMSVAAPTKRRRVRQPTAVVGGKPVASQRAVVGKITVRQNEDRDGVEILFPAKPDETVRSSLKEAGFRWHSTGGFWYAKRTEQSLAMAAAVARGGLD